MKINRLKIGQQVWVHNGEFPVKEVIETIDKENFCVWLSDGNWYTPNDIYSTEQRCKEAN